MAFDPIMHSTKAKSSQSKQGYCFQFCDLRTKFFVCLLFLWWSSVNRAGWPWSGTLWVCIWLLTVLSFTRTPKCWELEEKVLIIPSLQYWILAIKYHKVSVLPAGYIQQRAWILCHHSVQQPQGLTQTLILGHANTCFLPLGSIYPEVLAQRFLAPNPQQLCTVNSLLNSNNWQNSELHLQSEEPRTSVKTLFIILPISEALLPVKTCWEYGLYKHRWQSTSMRLNPQNCKINL